MTSVGPQLESFDCPSKNRECRENEIIKSQGRLSFHFFGR